MSAFRGCQGRALASAAIGPFTHFLCVAIILAGLGIPFPYYVSGSPTTMCIHTGYYIVGDGLATNNLPWRGYDESKDMYFTIGARIFRNKVATAQTAVAYGNLDKLFFKDKTLTRNCNIRPSPLIDPTFAIVDFCPDHFDIRTHVVSETFGSSTRLLRGWLHVQIELTDTDDEILWIAIQMKDENFNAVGEYIAEEKDQCVNPDPKKFATPTKYEILPCSAIGAREVKASQGIYAVKKELLFRQENADKIFGGQDISRGIQFTWRFSEYWCSKHEKIRTEAYVLSKKNLALYDQNPNVQNYKLLRAVSDYWMKPSWFGAADIRKFPHSELDCTRLAYNENDGTGYEGISWIDGTEGFTYETDVYFPPNRIEYPGITAFYKSCKVQLIQKEPGPPSFGGRCTDLVAPGANSSVLHTCNKDLKLDVKFQKYTDYVKKLTTNRSEQCQVTCRAPNATDLPAILKNHRYPPGYKGYQGRQMVNLTKSNTSAARYERGRKYHGILCIVCTMFFTPLSIFAARFYKETFMGYQVKSIHVWYWIHIGATVASLCMYLSSWSALLEGIALWGRSQTPAGIWHYRLGWLSNLIFLTMSLIGGFRLGAGTGGKIPRLAVMTLHSVFGFLTYFLNVFLVLNSTQIPQSPSLKTCNPSTGLPKGLSEMGWIMLLWVVVDIGFHIALTVLQFLTDRSMSIRRKWICPIIPILHPTSHDDMKGSALRKLLFAIYVVASFFLMLAAVIAVATHEKPSNCLPGPMSCDTEAFPYGCTNLAKDYAKIVKTKDT